MYRIISLLIFACILLNCSKVEDGDNYKILDQLENIYLDIYYDYQNAEICLDSLTKQILPEKLQPFKGEISFLWAFIYFQKKDVDLSLNYLQNGLELLTDKNNKNWISRCYLLLGWIAEETGNWEQAEINFYEVLKLVNGEKSIDLGLAYLGLARCKRNLNDAYESELKKGVKILQDSNIEEFVLYSQYILLMDDTINSKTIIKLKEIASEYAKLELVKNESNVYAKISSMYQKIDLIDSALFYVNKALYIIEKYSLSSYKFPLYLQLKSSQFYIVKDYKNAKINTIKAINAYDNNNNYRGKYFGYTLLSRIYEKEDSIELAYDYYKIAKQNEAKSNEILVRQTASIQETIFQTNLLKLEIQRILANKKKRIAIFVSILTIILTLSFWVSQGYYQKKIKEEKMRVAMQNLIIGLGERKLLLERVNCESTNNIYKEISKLTNTELFDECYIESLRKIRKRFENFSLTETRYAVMFGLHLEKEIILKINNTTDHAIKKAKYRLRQKLNLSSTESVEKYFEMILTNELETNS